jgi:hypothetical protein
LRYASPNRRALPETLEGLQAEGLELEERFRSLLGSTLALTGHRDRLRRKLLGIVKETQDAVGSNKPVSLTGSSKGGDADKQQADSGFSAPQAIVIVLFFFFLGKLFPLRDQTTIS